MNRSFWVGVIWFAVAVALIVASRIAGEETPWQYWFFLGVSMFFIGVSYILEEIKKVGDK